MKVVLDTNVLISGLMLPKSVPGSIVNGWKSGQFDLAFSEEMLTEVGRVLGYPKISKRLEWDSALVERFLLLLRYKAEVVMIDGIEATVPRDADDNMVLATLIQSRADYLVTGDQDLLELQEQYPIIAPARFVEYL